MIRSKREIFTEVLLPHFAFNNAVKFDTVEEILDRLDVKNKTIGIMNAPEFAMVLCEQSNNSNYILIDNDPLKKDFAKAKGIDCVTTEEYTNMKFDLIIQNPPFREEGKSSKCLYADFFNKSLECSEEVLSIMPTPGEQDRNGQWRKVHGKVYSHKKWIGRNISNDFVDASNHAQIKYGLYSKKINNPLPEKKDKFADWDFALPERPRMPRPVKGFTDRKRSSGPYRSILVSRKNETDYIVNLTHSVTNRPFSGEYLVIANEQFQWRHGRMNALVVKNEPNLGAERHMWVWSFNTKKEAERFKEWIHSDTITNELKKLWHLGHGSCMSPPKFALLPDVE